MISIYNHKVVFKILALSLCFATCAFTTANAQIEEQKKTEEELRDFDADFDKMMDKFENFKDHIEEKHKNFRDSIDRAFVRFMANSWKDFSVYAGNPSPLDPDKPSVQPNAPEPTFTPNRSNRSQEIQSEIINPGGTSADEDNKDFKPAPVSEDRKSEGGRRLRTLNVPFYGLDLPLQFDSRLDFNLEKPFNSGIPDAWEELAEADYYPTVMQFVTVSEKMNLNDWGYVQAVRKFAEELYPGHYNEQVLFTCFMLNKSGFLSKIGFNRTALFLLLPSPQEVYNTPYMTVEGLKYYVYSFDPDYGHISSIKTYEGKYRDNNHAINFNFTEAMNFPKRLKTRTVSYTDVEVHHFDIQYNQNLVDFYEDMPPVGFNVTLSAPLSSEAMSSFKEALSPMLEGKTEKQKVDFLLAFIQKGFDYKTDQDQFGVEKYFFPEEVLYYPYSDCEDRSALLAVLVKELTGLEVLGLVFPEHVATAVKFSADMPGDFVTYQDEKYLICDPTYIGAEAGMAMPKYKRSSVQLVLLD